MAGESPLQLRRNLKRVAGLIDQVRGPPEAPAEVDAADDTERLRQTIARLREETDAARRESLDFRRTVAFVHSEANDLDDAFAARTPDLRMVGDFLIALRKRAYADGRRDSVEICGAYVEGLADAVRRGTKAELVAAARNLIRGLEEVADVDSGKTT